MGFFDVFFYLSLAGGFLMSFALGANDAANSMASAVGAKAITVRQAVFIASIMNFIGASLLGGHVVATISKGIVDMGALKDPYVVTLGMFAVLLTSGLFVLISTLTGFPVSSTHAVIGGLMGFGWVAGGFHTVYWSKLVEIVTSWVISPVLGGLMAFVMYRILRWVILDYTDQKPRVQRWCPVWMGFTAGIIAVGVMIDIPALEHLQSDWMLVTTTVIFFVLYVWEMGKNLVREFLENLKDSEAVQAVFRRLQVVTSAFVALSHGSNDVANAFGPVVAVYVIAKTNRLPAEGGEVPVMLLVMGGIGIATGISALGKRVIKTVGEEITELDNPKGYSVDFSVATTVLLASRLGLPVSSTTVAVGAVTGVGLARGHSGVNARKLIKIFSVWVLTLPITGLTSAGLYSLLNAVLR